jgi:hypothetical protein
VNTPAPKEISGWLEKLGMSEYAQLYPAFNLTPQKRKEKTLQALVAQAEGWLCGTRCL